MKTEVGTTEDVGELIIGVAKKQSKAQLAAEQCDLCAVDT